MSTDVGTSQPQPPPAAAPRDAPPAGEEPPRAELDPRIRRCVLFGLLALAQVAVVLAAAAAAREQLLVAPAEHLAWVLAALTASVLSTRLLHDRLVVSLASPVVVAATLVFAPGVAALIGALGTGSWHRPTSRVGALAEVLRRVRVGASAAGAAVAADLAAGLGLREDTEVVLLTAVAMAAFLGLDLGLRVLTAMAWHGGHGRVARAAWSAGSARGALVARDVALAALLAMIVVAAYEVLGLLALALLALPLLLGWSALHSAQEASERAQQLDRRVRELEALHLAGRELLTARTEEAAAEVATRSLRRALGRADVDALLEPPSQPAVGLRLVPVPEAPPAVVRLPGDLDDAAETVAQSIAGGLGATILRQRLERELAEVQRARADLAGRILEEGVQERSRLGLALHDEVMPMLSGAQMAADNARSALETGDHQQAAVLAATLRDTIQDTVAQLRAVLSEIRRHAIVPGALRERLAGALEELQVQEGVRGRLEAPDPLPPLPFPVEILLWEATQSCLANIAEHAAADEAVVRLTVGEAELRMEIEDNGCGFDGFNGDDGHERDGLELLRQRIELARGRFLVESRPEAGTRTVVEVPR